jgi:N-acetylmuramoyl-L-alanine amidase
MIYYWGISVRRKRLLKGLFSENMRLLGKKPKRLMAGVRIKPITLSLLVFVAALGLMDSLGLSVVRGPGIMRSETDISRQSSLGVNYEPPPSEYGLLLSESFVSLKKLFGLEIDTIIIDAGHGGEDPGAIGGMGTREKDVTMDIAQRLRKRLINHKDYDIFMTRYRDKTVSLKERVEIANRSKSDLFVSIHVNYVPRTSMEIIETFYFGPSDSNDTLKLAERENSGSEFSLSDYNVIIKKLNETLKLQESRLFASSIQKTLYNNMRSSNDSVLDFGVKRAPFVVLMGTDVPGVLVEVTCLSNREEEERLKAPEYREKIAKYIEEGIINYLNSRGDS